MAETDISIQIVCYVCSASKALELFPKLPSGKYGRGTTCKACRAIYLKKYVQANRDRLKEAQKKRYLENKPSYQKAGKQNYQQKKDEYKARAKVWATKNAEKRLEITREWQRCNPEKRYEIQKKDRLKNPGRFAAAYKARQQRKRQALPSWANLDAIEAIYRQSAWATKMSGIKHHVDHFYPLKNDMVCGLHNEFNLRIIKAFDNLSKGNKFPTQEV